VRLNGAFFLILAVVPGPVRLAAGPTVVPSEGVVRDRSPRGSYILREIFGDQPRTAPAVWGVAPGIERSRIPFSFDLGREVAGTDGPLSFQREVAGRATVIFVFDGRGPDDRLHHVTVTVSEGPGISRKTLLAHLSKVYGPAEPDPAESQEERIGTWLRCGVVLRHFRAARFFEVTLASPRHPTGDAVSLSRTERSE